MATGSYFLGGKSSVNIHPHRDQTVPHPLITPTQHAHILADRLRIV